MNPRVLLLLENRATGGVSTIASRLAAGLRLDGWSLAEWVVRGSSMRHLWAAARGCDVILAAHNFFPAYVGWLLSLLTGRPLVVWVHGPVLQVLALARTTPLKQRALAWFYRRLSTCVFVSDTSRDSFEHLLGHLPATLTAAVVRNAAPAAADTSEAQSPDGRTIELAYVGRLSPEKQPLLLLDTIRLLPEHYRLTVVGDGPLFGEMRSQGADLVAAGRLILSGPQCVDETAYRRWRLTLLVSMYEGCPMSLLESLAHGVPCVSLPIPAAQEVLGRHAPQLLAHGHSARDLAEAIRDVLQLPKELLSAQIAEVLQRHRPEDFLRSWQQVLRAAARPC